MTKKKVNLITCITLLICFTLLSILSCTNDDGNLNNDAEYIKYGTSFGECIGYCVNTITITTSKVTLEKIGWTQNGSLPKITGQEELKTFTLEELFEKVDLDVFYSLDEIIGCPDCADNGAEWIEIKTDGKTHKVSFDYLTNEIPELENILESLRELSNSVQKDAYLVMDSDAYNTTSTDNYTITGVSLEDHILKFSINSSGCDGNTWFLSLIDSEALLESNPLKRKLKINLVNNEVCLAIVANKEYEINISELKVEGENELLLSIEGWDEPIIYNY